MHRPPEVKDEHICRPAPNLGPQVPLGPKPTPSDVENIIMAHKTLDELRSKISGFLGALAVVVGLCDVTFNDGADLFYIEDKITRMKVVVRLRWRGASQYFGLVLTGVEGIAVEYTDSLVMPIYQILPEILVRMSESIGPERFRKALIDYHNCARQ